MNIQVTNSFNLIVELLIPGDTATGKPAPIEVPAGCSFLHPATRDSRSLLSRVPESIDGGLVLEPVLNAQRQPRLLIVNLMPDQLRVNAEPAPHVALLRERDNFQFDDSSMFHVAIYQRPQIGPAPTDKVGKSCPVCLTPFGTQPNSICYCCPCGLVLHLRDPSGLECARAVRDCPQCHLPISLKEGFSWLPNLES